MKNYIALFAVSIKKLKKKNAVSIRIRMKKYLKNRNQSKY